MQIENKANVPVTVTIELKLTNAESSKPTPLTLDCSPRKKTKVLDLSAEDRTKNWAYKIRSFMRFGSSSPQRSNIPATGHLR